MNTGLTTELPADVVRVEKETSAVGVNPTCDSVVSVACRSAIGDHAVHQCLRPPRGNKDGTTIGCSIWMFTNRGADERGRGLLDFEGATQRIGAPSHAVQVQWLIVLLSSMRLSPLRALIAPPPA